MNNDLISRQDAINIPVLPKEHRKQFKSLDDAFETGWSEALSCVEFLPSADRPQGHYIKGKNGEYYCSECKRIDDKYSVARFCWHCGADMRKEKSDDD